MPAKPLRSRLMSIADDRQITQLRAGLIAGMREYMQSGDRAYDESHIAACDTILAKYLEEIECATDRASSLGHVKDAVLALNELHERCGYERIETDQREDICAMSSHSGAIAGNALRVCMTSGAGR